MEVTLTDFKLYVSREYTVPGFKRMLVIALHLKSERDYIAQLSAYHAGELRLLGY